MEKVKLGFISNKA